MSPYDVSPPSSSAGSSKDNFRSILRGRKCYRMSKDKNEVVWPPHLEAALMEGLEKYTPAESKSPRGLTRFPNRNKFISEYILKTTGEIRTAKQVGSRIQQLRDTSAGKTIMKAISDRHYEMMHPTRHEGAHGDDGLISDVAFAAGTMLPAVNQVVHVYISVPAPSSPAAAAWAPDVYGRGARRTEVNVLSGSMFQWSEPRTLRAIDPTVTFRSCSPLPLFSTFTVHCGGAVVHAEPPTIMNVHDTGSGSSSSGSGQGAYLHYTTLCPGYWETLCSSSSSDLSSYLVVQEISKQGTDAAQKPSAVLVVNYHFTTAHAPPLSPFALHEDELEVDYEPEGEVYAPLAHALSTCSDSPYPSDRSSSPSGSIPTGFASTPLSPVDWQATPGWGYAQALSSHTHTLSSHAQGSVQGQGYYGLAPLQPSLSRAAYQYCQ